jgi:ABC-2 type transport system ATP-binding protein
MKLQIEAQHLSKTFGSLAALQDLNLSIAAGEIYGLVGPDGAGKTTALRLLCGAMFPDTHSGSPPPLCRIAGLDILHHTEQARACIGYLPQRFSLYEDLTVMENLRFFAEVRGLKNKVWQPRCMEILQFVGLRPYSERLAGHLSGGMKQKLGLAAALVHQPQILLLDEPTTGVDPVTRQDFWQLIIRLAGGENLEPVTVLISTPYMDEAARCSRVGFLRQGRLLVEGTPGELRALIGLNRVLELRGQPLLPLRQAARQVPGVADAMLFGDRIHLRLAVDADEPFLADLRRRLDESGGEVSSLRTVPPQLEDVFMTLVEDNP